MKQSKPLKGKKIVILLTDGFEEHEVTKPRKALKKAGATTLLVSPKGKIARSWQFNKWGKYFAIDKNISDLKLAEIDGLVLPGGVINPDKLRTDKKAIALVDHFLKNKKPVAAICHGPWTMIETGKLKGRTLTSYPSIKTDLINAGAKWKNMKMTVTKTRVFAKEFFIGRTHSKTRIITFSY